MPQRVANISITLNRKEGRIPVKAGETYNFTKDEIDQLTKLNKDALRKPVNEELPEEANNDGSERDPSTDEIDTTSKDDGLTPAQKAAQTRAAKKSAAAEEDGTKGEEEAL